MTLSTTEENYLKAIFKLCSQEQKNAATNDIAELVQTKAASVTDMLKKLADKELIVYEKYKGVSLTKEGDRIARMLVRNHRLWEVFLVSKLGYKWYEVHPIAEQLEHIAAELLIEKLDAFLGYPKYDPHGDPIPDAQGNIIELSNTLLSDISKGKKVTIVGVKDTSSSFLKYLDTLMLTIGSKLTIKDVIEFDRSMIIEKSDKSIAAISSQIAQNILVHSMK
jgi:DtxR family transcriptional regulator, Mn-dependent transcriptional regulator